MREGGRGVIKRPLSFQGITPTTPCMSGFIPFMKRSRASFALPVSPALCHPCAPPRRSGCSTATPSRRRSQRRGSGARGPSAQRLLTVHRYAPPEPSNSSTPPALTPAPSSESKRGTLLHLSRLTGEQILGLNRTPCTNLPTRS